MLVFDSRGQSLIIGTWLTTPTKKFIGQIDDEKCEIGEITTVGVALCYTKLIFVIKDAFMMDTKLKTLTNEALNFPRCSKATNSRPSAIYVVLHFLGKMYAILL